MKWSDIDLTGVKLAIFDFDGTLALHEDENFAQRRKESDEAYINFFTSAYKNPETFYDDTEPCRRSEALYALICEMRKRNIKIFCLSGMGLTFHLKAKQAFVNKYYGDDIEVLTVASQDRKLKGVQILQNIVGCNLDEVLFVDDLREVIKFLSENGIKGIHADEITL